MKIVIWHNKKIAVEIILKFINLKEAHQKGRTEEHSQDKCHKKDQTKTPLVYIYNNLFSSTMNGNKLTISFDELNRIRILNADDFKQTETLSEECTNFSTSKYIVRTRVFECAKGRCLYLSEIQDVGSLYEICIYASVL